MQKQIQVLEARIGRYEAEELRAQAGIKLAEAGIESAEARLQQAKSSMSGAEASLAAAEAEFGRTSDLVDRQSLQRRMLDEVRKKRDTEVANQSSAESSIVSAEADVIVAQAELASAEANMAAAKSETEVAHKQLEELKVFMDYATLKAPFAGIVTSRSIDLGDLVQQDSQDKSLFVVSQIDKVRVQMPVPEAAAALVNPGDAVTLTLPSFSGETAIKTTVTRVSGSLDPSSRTMLVESELENKDNKLIPGMFGQASITLATNVAANMLPARAIRFAESGQAYVYALGDDETVSVIDITTGIDDGSKIEVLSGVSEGQRVIDAHLKRFKDGQKVALLD
jgi:RND family efflux transporter MFP subunit